MKKIILLVGLAAMVCSCRKTGQPVSTSTSFKLDTAITITQPQTTIAGTSFGSTNPSYSLLGYGYDVNGRYADSNAVRAQVIDMAAFGLSNSDRLGFNNSTSGGQDVRYANNAEDFSARLSDQLPETQGTKSFKGAIAAYFPNAADVFSAKYFYCSSSLEFHQKQIWVNAPEALLQQSLTAAFKQDQTNLSAEALVNKYGTHILTSVDLGTKVNILYRAQTSISSGSDRSRAVVEGMRFALKRIFILSTGYLDNVDSAKLATIHAQTISYYAVGGDRSLIKKLITATDKRTVINVFDFIQNATLANAAFIGFGRNGLLRLDKLISDPAKKAAVKAYIDNYISMNQVKVVN